MEQPIKLYTLSLRTAYKLDKNMQSKANSLNKEDFEKWGMNFLKFVAPTLALFFGQLAVGVSIKVAWPLAVFALYQSLSDLFSKYKEA